MSQHPEHDPFRDLPHGPRQPNDEKGSTPQARGRETLRFGYPESGSEQSERANETTPEVANTTPESIEPIARTPFEDSEPACGRVPETSGSPDASTPGERVSPLEEYRRAREESLAAETESESALQTPSAMNTGVFGPGLTESLGLGGMLGSDGPVGSVDRQEPVSGPDDRSERISDADHASRDTTPAIERVAFDDTPEPGHGSCADERPAVPAVPERTPRADEQSKPEIATFRVETAVAPTAAEPEVKESSRTETPPPAEGVTSEPDAPEVEPESDASESTPEIAVEPEAVTPPPARVPTAPKFRPMSTPANRSVGQAPVHPQKLVEQLGADMAAKQTAEKPAPQPAEPTQYRPLHTQEYHTPRPDALRQPEMVKRGRAAHLPTIYGIWWLATLLLFVLSTGLGAHYGLDYFGFDLWTLTMADLQDKHVFLVLGGSLLASLFLVWGLQNVAKSTAHQKPNPGVAFNNMYGLLVCLMIVAGLKFASDVVSTEALADDLADLAWLRGEEPEAKSTSPRVVTTPPTQGDTASTGGTDGASLVPGGTGPAEPTPNMVSPFEKPKPETVISLNGGRDVVTSQHSGSERHTEVRAGDPTKPVMASSIRAFQNAAGRVRSADRAVAETPQPDLSSVATAEPIEAVAAAHREAFEAHRALSRLAADLPNTSRLQMLEAGASVRETDAQVASLTSLLNLKGAAVLHEAEASVHAARAAYAAFLANQFGAWRVEDGSVRFDDDEAGATASYLQSTIGERERDLQDAKMSLFES